MKAHHRDATRQSPKTPELRKVCVSQTDVEFRKGKRTLEMKEKNNFLATANVRETEFISKKSRVAIEPSEDRYDEHLNYLNTPPPFQQKTRSFMTVQDDVATSSGKPIADVKDNTDDVSEKEKNTPTATENTSSEKGMGMVVRKAFLGLF